MKVSGDVEFLGVIWFNEIGIVRVRDPYDGIKYYIKVGHGLSEDADIQTIMQWGQTFPKNAGDVLFGVNDA